MIGQAPEMWSWAGRRAALLQLLLVATAHFQAKLQFDYFAILLRHRIDSASHQHYSDFHKPTGEFVSPETPRDSQESRPQSQAAIVVSPPTQIAWLDLVASPTSIHHGIAADSLC